jgi:hypothetical protein
MSKSSRRTSLPWSDKKWYTHTYEQEIEQTRTDYKSDKIVLSEYASALVTSVTESSYGSASMSHHRHNLKYTTKSFYPTSRFQYNNLN